MTSPAEQLEAKAKLNKSDFTLLRDQDLPVFVERLIATAGNYVEPAADYGLSQEMITELSTSVEDFRPMVGLARLKQNEGHVANAEVSQLLSQALELLKTKMDKVMLQFNARLFTFNGRRTRRH